MITHPDTLHSLATATRLALAADRRMRATRRTRLFAA